MLLGLTPTSPKPEAAILQAQVTPKRVGGCTYDTYYLQYIESIIDWSYYYCLLLHDVSWTLGQTCRSSHTHLAEGSGNTTRPSSCTEVLQASGFTHLFCKGHYDFTLLNPKPRAHRALACLSQQQHWHTLGFWTPLPLPAFILHSEE